MMHYAQQKKHSTTHEDIFMINFYGEQITKANTQELFEILKRLDKLYPGISESICTVYLSRLEKKYPHVIDNDLRKIILVKFAHALHEKNTEDMLRTLQLIQNDLPAALNERQILSILAVATMVMKQYSFAVWLLAKVHMSYLLNTESFSQYVEKMQNDHKMQQDMTTALNDFLTMFKTITLEQYSYYTKK
jgi:hypothetical protein